MLGGTTISQGPSPTNDPTNPRYTILADNIHPGTVVNGLEANLFIRAVNLAYGTNIQPFSDQEILTNADITPGIAGPTYFNIDPFAFYNPVPEPSSLALAIAAAICCPAAVRRHRNGHYLSGTGGIPRNTICSDSRTPALRQSHLDSR